MVQNKPTPAEFPVAHATGDPALLPADTTKLLEAKTKRKGGPARQILLYLLAGLILGAGAMWGIVEISHDHTGEVAQGATTYYCPMHPHVRQEKPGDCPICWMALVPLEGSTGNEMAASDGVLLTKEAAIKANVSTASVAERTFSKQIRTIGTVTFAERGQEVISARIGGRLEKLFASATGDRIKVGTPLFSIYSPELLNAQQEYLLARKTHMASHGSTHTDRESSLHERLIDAGRQRLLLLGMTDGQIRALEQEGRASSTTTVYAKTNGIVIEKLVQEGAYVAEGTPILQTADLSTVWVEAEIFEEDIRFIREGATVSVASEAYPGEHYTGRVIFISPVANSASRTVVARIALPNPALKFRPQMFVDVEFNAESRKGLAIPASAVIRGGGKDYVWLRRDDGSFVRRDVTLGTRSEDDYYHVTSGLSVGEAIAVTGAFLVDSEHEFMSTIDPHAGHKTDNPDKTAEKPISSNTATAHGTVVSVDAAKQRITLDHEKIPGIMSAMVMPFQVADVKLLSRVQKGDRVQFSILKKENGSYVLTNINKH